MRMEVCHSNHLATEGLSAVAGSISILEVGPCFSSHPVSFALLTTGTMQFVGYYDELGEMTVASRRLDSLDWMKVQLGERVGWDSHNGMALGWSCPGELHLSGNMHASSLVYFRTTRADDIRSFERKPGMTGSLESEVTYPNFFYGPETELHFGYRHGSSGRGDQIYNSYNADAQQWERPSGEPVVSGEGIRNAYLDGPVYGPDGFFHLCWVWRDTPDCSTNHDVCYARSSDFVHWETSGGVPLKLPITASGAEVIDPVPVGAGLLNGNVRVGFDAGMRVVVTYHKVDASGNTQIYNARRESGGWKIFKTSDWTGTWLPEGNGTIEGIIGVHPVRVDQSGRLLLPYRHRDHGNGIWILDPVALRPLGALAGLDSQLPEEFQIAGDGMKRNWVKEIRPAAREQSGPVFALTWESLPENRDKPRSAVPVPSCLKLVRFVNASEVFLNF